MVNKMKNDRHSLILKLINENEICTQEELTERLIAHGYKVSQSTVSRDISVLNLIKAEGNDKKSKYVQAIVPTNTISNQKLSLLKHIMVSVANANNLIVLKTLSGNAGSAGMIIDEINFPQVLGSVAGDDVVLIVAKSEADAEIVVKSIRTINA